MTACLQPIWTSGVSKQPSDGQIFRKFLFGPEQIATLRIRSIRTDIYLVSTLSQTDDAWLPGSRLTSRHLAAVLPFAISLLVTLGVLSVGWISDDGYISARYADNLLHGYGLVFNPGEHVQGFTHPLWLAFMIPVQALLREPLLVAVALGALFTFATFRVAWRALVQTGAQTPVAIALLAAFAFVLSASEAWRSFQTSGLENSLTHLLLALVVLEVGRRDGLRPQRVSLLAALLALTRLDLAVLVAPLALHALRVAFRARALRSALLAYAPLLAWLLFAQLYYGSVIPNTATSKLGMYGFQEGIAQGLNYAADWLLYEPQNALVLLASIGLVAFGPLRTSERWLAAGVALYTLALIVGGGDFMRGRMLLPIFFSLLLLACVAAARLPIDLSSLNVLKRRALLAAGLFLMLYVAAPGQAGYAAARALGPQLYGLNGISNERAFYRDQSLRHYLTGATPLQIAETWEPQVQPLKAFTQSCGSFAVLTGRIGAISYALGPAVQVVDLYGLTDSTISHLPQSSLIDGSRTGHPQRMLPLSYLASRGDITLFANWRDAVAAGDCGIIAAARTYTSSNALVAPFDVASRPTYTP